MENQDIDRNKSLLQVYKDRLFQLEMQNAIHGINVPFNITHDIEYTKKQIESLESNMRTKNSFDILERLISNYCTAFDSENSYFIPLGMDQPVRLDKIYQELAIYRQFSSPHYKSRHDLINDMNAERHSDLIERIMIQTDNIINISINQFEQALLDHQERGLSLASSRVRAIENFLRQNHLIDDLIQLRSPDELQDLLCNGLVRMVLRNLLSEIGYQDGILSKLLNDHSSRISSIFL